jgi:hypothetical protein
MECIEIIKREERACNSMAIKAIFYKPPNLKYLLKY